MSAFDADESASLTAISFLAASHDLGKCMPAFQSKKFPDDFEFETLVRSQLNTNGLHFRTDLENPNAVKHATVSQWYLERNSIPRQLAVVVGGHHGKPPYPDIGKVEAYPDNVGLNDIKWNTLRKQFLDFALRISNADIDAIRSLKLSSPGQVLVTGIIIMADWIASNEYLFPLSKKCSYSTDELRLRVDYGWASLHLPSHWKNINVSYPPDNLFRDRFGFNPRPFQSAALKIASECSEPGIYIIEAPMGEGKTEAALGMAEELAAKFGQTGIFFALPTQATADGVFPRMIEWIRKSSCDVSDPGTIFLAHGKSIFNKVYSSIPSNRTFDTDDRLIVHEWLNGKKRGLLSDFVVGTVDQVLMAGLKRRHLALRHMGLAGKVVVIDEVHAYDEYMGSYLEKSLMWFGSYGVPVILLSATLPLSRRKSLVGAYLRGKRVRLPEGEWCSDIRYPLVTFTEGSSVRTVSPPLSGRSSEVDIIRISGSDLLKTIENASKNGGYVGIIVNTVSRAQKIYKQLSEIYGDDEVRLLHSRFTALDRTAHEAEVMRLLGKGRSSPPYRLLVIGTQVMEQSLDLDFDVLFTDMCPMDLLIQRMGRLHRHDNTRPIGLERSLCYVIDGGDSARGSEAVYGAYQLINSRLLLPVHVSLPNDIPKLVQTAYGKPLDVPLELKESYAKAIADMEYAKRNKEQKAKIYQISTPSEPDLMRWLENDLEGNDDLMAEATVRDTDGVVEVILVRNTGDGEFVPVTSDPQMNNHVIPRDIDESSAFALAGCKVALPHRWVACGRMQGLIEELTALQGEFPPSWRASYWLRNELFLQLNGNNIVALKYGVLQYSTEVGLMEMTDD